MKTYLDYIPMKTSLGFQVESKRPSLRHEYLGLCKFVRSVKTRQSRCLYYMLAISWLVASAFILNDLLHRTLLAETNRGGDRRARQRTGNFAQSFTLDVPQSPANLEAYKSRFKPLGPWYRLARKRPIFRALGKGEAKTSGGESGGEGGEIRSRRLVAAANVAEKVKLAIGMGQAKRHLATRFSAVAEKPIMMQEPITKAGEN